jgi:carbon-monoxide dehydrogenase large subunit
MSAPRVVGQRARRIEDPALLRGAGRFVDDIELPGLVHAAFVRSPHAHALIRAIDAAEARRMPGVQAVYTAADLRQAGVRLRLPLGFPSNALPEGITPFVLTPTEVCYVGEAVAMVIADSRYLAEDAAAAVTVDYEPLPIVADVMDAIEAGAPKARRESASNVLTRFRIAYGDAKASFAAPARVFGERLEQHRGAAHPMEGRGTVARYEAGEDRLTVWSSTQMAHDL